MPYIFCSSSDRMQSCIFDQLMLSIIGLCSTCQTSKGLEVEIFIVINCVHVSKGRAICFYIETFREMLTFTLVV